MEGCGISERPPESAHRAVPGHWEGDLVVGGDMASCLVTLVERRTRFLVARRLMAHDTKTVVDLLVEMCAEVPGAVRDGLLSTLTWDQGCELADAARFTLEMGVSDLLRPPLPLAAAVQIPTQFFCFFTQSFSQYSYKLYRNTP